MVKLNVLLTLAIILSVPIRYAAPPADAEYSKASPGAPCDVSAPMATPYFISPDDTMPRQIWMAAVPALHANSRSAAVIAGVASIASATMVDVGLTAYGCDSEPMYTAPMSFGLTSGTLAIMFLAASVAMVTTSSSGLGTDF